MKKTIWIINQYAVAPYMPGGTRHYDFGVELVKRGYNITTFASSFHYNLHKELKLTRNEKWRVENVNGVRFVWIRTFPHQKNDWRRVINMLSFTTRVYIVGKSITKKRSLEKPDVIIGSAVHLFAVLSAYLLARHYHATFIMEVRDLWPQTFIDMGVLKEKNLTTKMLRLLENFLYGRAQKIIVLSPLSRDYLISLDVSKDKISLIPQGVDISRYENVPPNKKINKVFNVIYAGSLGVVNALTPILWAAQSIQKMGIKNIHFIFVGEGVQKENLIKQAKILRLTNVEFRKAVPKIKIPTLLEGADVLLLSEHTILYGSSNKLFDYMASGKPIIFSTPAKHNAMKAVNCGIYVPQGDAKALVKALLTFYRMSPREREKIGEKGEDYVRKHYAIPILVDKLEKAIYGSCN